MYKWTVRASMLSFGFCFGAAEEVVKKFVGVGCKTGTVVTAHAEPFHGTYICAYVHTTKDHITKMQLQEIATGIVGSTSGRKTATSSLIRSVPSGRKNFFFRHAINVSISRAVYVFEKRTCS